MVSYGRLNPIFVGKGIIIISEIVSNDDLKLEKHNFRYYLFENLGVWVDWVSFAWSEIDSDR